MSRAGKPALGVRLAAAPDGEILARANVVMAGYWRNADATSESLDGGWFHTGDGGSIDAGGCLTISDRKKDVIITGGENVSSIEVEDTLFSHPAVAEAAVIGVPSQKWGETVKALVVLAPGEAADEAELIAHCKRHLAGYKAPTSVEFLPEIPRTATGKIQKFKLREPYWAEAERRSVDCAFLNNGRRAAIVDVEALARRGNGPRRQIGRVIFVSLQHRSKGTVVGVAALLASVGPATAVAAPVADSVTLRFDEGSFDYDRPGFDNTFSVGDTYTVTSELRRPGKSRKVGTTRTHCTSVEVVGPAEAPENVRWRCVIRLKTVLGTIRAQGEHDFRANGSVRYAIVAGTGTYTGADGKINRQYVDDAKNRLTLRFSTDRPA